MSLLFFTTRYWVYWKPAKSLYFANPNSTEINYDITCQAAHNRLYYIRIDILEVEAKFIKYQRQIYDFLFRMQTCFHFHYLQKANES